MALYIVKPWYKKEEPPTPALIYGAEWAGGSSPAWTRTDAAANFADPNPYYSGMSGTPSSPFDDILPWSGLRRVTDSAAGELVEIPKFYYKWTRDGIKMKLQISMYKHDGFLCSPAHADRGDGVGERNYVYVGRYKCATDYKSKTGVLPENYITISTFRTGIHNLGTNIWQNDFALFWTIRMLYLVEYANWNCQTKIGQGEGNGSMTNTGLTDNMPYHTGTMQTSRSTIGSGIQYRYIEDLWANGDEFIDGIYRNKSSYNVRIINNPTYFGQISDTYSESIGDFSYVDGYIKSYSNNHNWAIAPSTIGGNNNAYICDYTQFGYDPNIGDQNVVPYNCRTGSVYHNTGGSRGLFFIIEQRLDDSASDWMSRLMVLPPSRLSA